MAYIYIVYPHQKEHRCSAFLDCLQMHSNETFNSTDSVRLMVAFFYLSLMS